MQKPYLEGIWQRFRPVSPTTFINLDRVHIPLFLAIQCPETLKLTQSSELTQVSSISFNGDSPLSYVYQRAVHEGARCASAGVGTEGLTVR